MKHPSGTFCWMDIYLPDQDKGKAFYGGLFGWDWTDVPMGDSGMLYTVFNLNGKSVGALGPEMPGMLPEGVPPHWFSYLATDDLDSTAELAGSLGATFVMGPADVGNGRVALMQDPSGASVFLWQALDFGGAEVIRSPGAFAWNELYTRDLETTQGFYSDLFGWEWSSMPIPEGGDYHLAAIGDYMVCGVLDIDHPVGRDTTPLDGLYPGGGCRRRGSQGDRAGWGCLRSRDRHIGRTVRGGQRRPEGRLYDIRAPLIGTPTRSDQPGRSCSRPSADQPVPTAQVCKGVSIRASTRSM